MTWLQGGPYLEASLLMVLEADRQSFANNILTKLNSFTPTVELAITENELKEKISEFNIGYPDDDKDPNSKIYYQTQIPVYVEIGGKRKSVLSLSQISDKLVAVDFWFYGSVWDAPEWNQIGVKENQIQLFKNMLHNLFDTFQFAIGTLGYENSVTDLFATSEPYPSEKYSLDNINRQSLQVDNYFSLIIGNKNYIDLEGISGFVTRGQKLTLEPKK